jgi:hypothetical protein
MPLYWTIDSELKTVDIVAEDDVTLADAMAFFDAIEQAAALPYNKLFDGSRGRAAMTAEELMAVVVRIRTQHGLSAMGALAVVASPEQARQLARLLGAAAVADRPLKVFDELKSARRWFAAQLPARA